MADRSEDRGPRRPATRPFVSGRPAVHEQQPGTFSYAPSRPFSLTGARERAAETSTSSLSIARSQTSPTPIWTVAVYEPGLEHVAKQDEGRIRLTTQGPSEDLADASLALADDILEAQRYASSIAAADVLELVARRLRRGEILLLPGASTQTEAAVVSSVLATLLGGRR